MHFELSLTLVRSFQLNPVERYAMRFVEDTGANWAAIQIKAVEAEIEQQKREWEEKRALQRQQEELEKQRAEKEENEILTYSREDAMNKVNIRSKKNSQVLGKRKSEITNHSPKSNAQGKKSNGTEVTRNGVMSSEKLLKMPPKKFDSLPRRNTRNTSSRLALDEKSPPSAKTNSQRMLQRGNSRKSNRSTSIQSVKSHVRSTSESTSRSAADSMSLQTGTTNHSPDESDSECSLDVMIDSNDVNDSDSNSNQITGNSKRHRFESTSQDDDTLLNDDSTMTDETTIDKMSKKSMDASTDGKTTSSPRTRSRGTVNVNLWTLDESPILPPKRQKPLNSRFFTEAQPNKDEKELRANFGVKDCKVSIVDFNAKLKPPSTITKPSPKSRAQKNRLPTKPNQTLDSWVTRTPNIAKDQPDETRSDSDKESIEERMPVTRQRRSTVMQKTM